MAIDRLHRFLTLPATKLSHPIVRLWLGFSLVFAVICGGLALKYAFAADYMVDSDARQHVYWMQRFSEPGLYPQDWITNYHQSVAPPGYTALYWLINQLGITPLTFNKLLPIGLGLIITVYSFFTCLELLPLPFAGFVSTLLLNQTLWMRYDLVSGTPRSFVYPLLMAFLYYLLRRKLLPCLVALALQGLFYPQILFVSAGILLLRLWHWQAGKLQLSRDRQDYRFCIAGLVVAFLVLLPFALQTSEFGLAVSAATAKTMPEFLPGGRTRFFHSNFWEYWFYGKRSGIMPQLDMPPFALVGLGLPVILAFPARFPLAQQVASSITLLGQTVVASLGMFLIAHALLFKLHLPSRYTMHSLPIVLALAAGIALVLGLDALLRWAEQISLARRRIALSGLAALAAVLVLYPAFTGFPYTKYKQGKAVLLYEFLAQQPQDTLVASIAAEADNIPTFARRSVLVSDMYAIPYHVGYYREIRQRSQDLIQAQYSPDLAVVQQFIRQYGIDFWLLDTNAFRPEYLSGNNWLMQYPNSQVAIAQLQQGIAPALAGQVQRCTVLQTRDLQLLEANCLVNP